MNGHDETGQEEERRLEREAQLLFEQLADAHESLGPLYVLHIGMGGVTLKTRLDLRHDMKS
jgi:hypothetical protein